jgi:double-strand break repair protein MRE11
VLLGGDLFHLNKPTRKSMHGVIRSLKGLHDRRAQLLRDDPSAVEDIECTGEGADAVPPYPVFIVHGNHDDPAGDGALSAIDILSAAGLVTYFGKSANIDRVDVRPLIITKGTTRVAVYGLGNIRDERLSRTWDSGNVHFHPVLLPNSTKVDPTVFHILVLHQNRAQHSVKNFVNPANIPGWVDFVLWGHEHECRIVPEFTPGIGTGPGAPHDQVLGTVDGQEEEQPHAPSQGGDEDEEDDEDEDERELDDSQQARRKRARLRGGRGANVAPLAPSAACFVCQPGSSVATSLSEGEAVKKHVGVLTVEGRTFSVTPHPLETVRPFVMDNMSLATEGIAEDDEAALRDALIRKVDEMLALPELQDLPPELSPPLVRLRVEVERAPTLAVAEVGKRFVGRIANVTDVVHFFRRRAQAGRQRGMATEDEEDGDLLESLRNQSETARLEALLGTYLREEQASKLEILPDSGLTGALRQYVEKDERQAIESFISTTLSDTQKFLQQKAPADDADDTDRLAAIVREHTARMNQQLEEQSRSAEALADDADREVEAVASRKRGRAAPAASSSSSRARGRNAAPADKEEEEEEEDNDDDHGDSLESALHPAPRSSRTGRRAASSSSAAAAKRAAPRRAAAAKDVSVPVAKRELARTAAVDDDDNDDNDDDDDEEIEDIDEESTSRSRSRRAATTTAAKAKAAPTRSTTSSAGRRTTAAAAKKKAAANSPPSTRPTRTSSRRAATSSANSIVLSDSSSEQDDDVRDGESPRPADRKPVLATRAAARRTAAPRAKSELAAVRATSDDDEVVGGDHDARPARRRRPTWR